MTPRARARRVFTLVIFNQGSRATAAASFGRNNSPLSALKYIPPAAAKRVVRAGGRLSAF